MHIYSNNINFCFHNSWAFRDWKFNFLPKRGKEEDSLHFSSFSVSLGYSKESAEGRRFYSRKLLREAAELFHFDKVCEPGREYNE
jgi:hypothetical protein